MTQPARQQGSHSTHQIDEMVARIWREVLRCESLSPTDRFFQLGGDSASMMIVLFRVGEALDVELPPGLLLDAPVLSDFSRRVQSILDEREHSAAQGTVDEGVI